MALQNSTIKYVLSHSDSDVEIMCESGYLASSEECGNGSAHSMLYIPSITPNKGDKIVFPMLNMFATTCTCVFVLYIELFTLLK